MASIPALGTRWREKRTRKVVEVYDVSYSTFGEWVVKARPVSGRGSDVIAKAHYFTTEGFEYVPEADSGQ